MKLVNKTQVNFTIVNNSVVRDSSLHLKAIGLYTYLVSMPNDWIFYLSELSKHFADGIDGVRSAADELEEHGYLKRTRLRDGKGHFKDTQWIIYSEPQKAENPILENPIQGNPILGNPTLLNTNLTKDEYNKELNIYSSTEVEQHKSKSKTLTKKLEEEFEQIWKDYPKKRGKQKALSHYKAWRKRSKGNTFEKAKKALSAYKRYVETTRANRFRDLQWRDGSTWFNGGMDDDYSVDDPNGKKLQNLDSLLNTAPEGIISDDDLPF